MLTIHQLLGRLHAAGVRMRSSAGELVLTGNPESVDAPLIAAVRAHKPALLAMIGPDSEAWWRPPVPRADSFPLANLQDDELERIIARVPGGAPNLQDIYPLAPLQEGMFFHSLLETDGDPYLMRGVQRFETRELLDAYVAALGEVVARHDVLRTAICWEGLREPLQVVWRDAPLKVEEIDLDNECDAAEQADTAESGKTAASGNAADADAATRLYQRFNPRHYRIDLREAPLLRVFVARDAADGSWLLLLMRHHLVSDHVTQGFIRSEIQAFLDGRGAGLPAPVPFRNHVARARLGVREEEHIAFFEEMLGDVTEPTAPFGLSDVWGDGAGIEEAWLELPLDVVARIRERARRLGVSAASLCHVAWALVLARVSGRADVVFGTVLSGRASGQEEAAGGVGMFLNTLPVRVRVGSAVGGGDVTSAVRGMHALLAALLQHEHASLALAQRCSGVKAPAPLFTSLLNYRLGGPRPGGDGGSGAAGKSRKIVSEERTNYPLMLAVEDRGSHGLWIETQVRSAIGASRVCALMRTALSSLADALESEPARALETLDVLPPEERARIDAWNQTEQAFPQVPCVHELFEAQVKKTPDAVAVIAEHVGLSYAELNRRANRLAHHLRCQGAGPETRVAICMDRGVDLMIALLAVLKAGAAYVPLDPGYPTDRLRTMVLDRGLVAVVTERHLRERVEALAASPNALTIIDADADRDRWKHEPASNPAPPMGAMDARRLAYVIYTSGSTGIPKGVANEHRGVVNRLHWMQQAYGLGRNDAVLQKTPSSFDVSVWEFFWPLMTGARLVMARPDGHKDPAYLCDAIRRHAITTLHFVPSMLDAFLTHHDSGACATIVNVICSGEALPASLVERFQQTLRSSALHNLYGPTEAAVDVTAWTCPPDITPTCRIPIGAPIANTRMYVLDAKGEPLPIGVTGELHIGGIQVARGYLARPDLTAERFIPDHLSSRPSNLLNAGGARMYRTGDLARWLPDGTIEYLGRNDFQVKIRGFRIELGEIEAQLAAHEGIREATVVAREDTPGEKRLVAYYTSNVSDGASAEGADDTSALRTHLSSRLPEYMIPSAFVHLAQMPLSPNGKLDRSALPAPELDAYAARGYEAPIGEIEEAIASAWADVLKLERVGRRDNFFELGGHSLLVLRAVERLRHRGAHLDVRALFATPTVAALAAQVDPHHERAIAAPPNLIPPACDAITPEMLPLVELTAGEVACIVEQVPGGAANVQDIYPLAPLQEGILFHHLLEGEGDPYLLAAQFDFESRAECERFVAAMQAVVDRHDILRTAIVWEGLREPVQVVQRRAVVEVEEIDLDPADGDVAEQLFARFNPRCHRIDVRRAPMLRLHVAHDQTKDRWLLLVLRHHLTGDHTASEVMQDEIRAHLSGETARLSPPPPFRNQIARARLGVGREEHETFFRGLLADVDEPTAPFGLLNVQRDGTGMDVARMPVDASLARRIRARARTLGVSAASVCHVAWAQVLSRVSGKDDVVFGTVLFGRMQGGEGADRAMGLFINTLPVRLRLGVGSAAACVRETHLQLAELQRHEHATLALAQRCSAVPPPMPLFSALLNYRHSGSRRTPPPAARRGQSGVRNMRVLNADERTNYPLTLSVDDLGGGFALTARVDASIEANRVCALMHSALSSLADALEHRPHAAVRGLDVLPAGERQTVLAEWNHTGRDYARGVCVHEIVEAQVARTPDAVAIVRDGERLSYRVLNQRANRLAHHLRALGVGPNHRVAICVERSPELVMALLAVLKAGAAYVPLDPAYPAERLRFMLDDSQPLLVLTDGRHDGMVSGLRAQVPIINLADALTWSQPLYTNPEWPGAGPRGQHVAYVMYTSGSTGTPKGVMTRHESVVNRLAWGQQACGLDATEAVLGQTSLCFDVSVRELLWPLTVGARIALLRPGCEKDPADVLGMIRRERVSTLNVVPSLLRVLVEHPDFARCTGVTRVLCSGETLPAPLVERLHERLPAAALHNVYGPSEAASATAALHCQPRDSRDTRDPQDARQANGARGNPSIGGPTANTRLYILDRHGEPAPIGVTGELHIGGTPLAHGYWRRAALTAERFVPDPFASDRGARVYRTGDLGRWQADGTIEFVGRNDQQVKIRGQRIELGEIEARLKAHDAIRDAVVMAREDVPGETRLVAYYTCTAIVDAPALRGHLLERLPEYMTPSAFVLLPEMPLTPNGKLDRRALPAPARDAHAVPGYEAPDGPVEETIARIWADVLKLERIGRRDHFFELGGHSLLVVRVMTRLRQALEVDVTIADLFQHPVLADLARHMAHMGRAALPAITIADRTARLPLSFAQQRLWFLSQRPEVSQAYHMPMRMRLAGALDRDALRRALDRIVERHEVLRTTFAVEDGEPVQRIGAARGFTLIEHDLRHLRDARDAEVALQRVIAEEAHLPFDLEAGPLVRGRLIRVAADEHVLLVTMHHIVADGWSMEVWRRELRTLYAAFRRGRRDPLPALPVQYADYAVWQRRWLEGERMAQQASYWKQTLAGAPAVLTLPTDRPRPERMDHAGASLRVVLDEELTRGLRALSRRHGTTLFMTLMAGWAAVLARLAGQPEVVIGTPVANRGRAEIEPLIGFFVNTLVLRLAVGDAPTVGDLLMHVKQQTIAAQQHQDIPFEHVVELVAPVRSLAHSPLFQVVFAWQTGREEAPGLPGVELRPERAAADETTKLELGLSLRETGDRIHGSLTYATALFDPSRIAQYWTYFRRVLEAMVADDTQIVARLPILPDGERARMLSDWNRTDREYPRDACVHEMFEAQVARTPDAVALVSDDDAGGGVVSYRGLNEQANRLASHLRTLGVRPDQRVAICLERGVAMVAAMLAVLKAGGAYVPLDPDAPPARVAAMMDDSTPIAVLTTADRAERFADRIDAARIIDVSEPARWKTAPSGNPTRALAGLHPDHLAYVIYTSGSTGTPKAVMVTHRGVCNLLAWRGSGWPLDTRDGVLQNIPVTFDAAVVQLLWPLVAGARAILARPSEAYEPTYVWDASRRHKVTTGIFPTPVLAALLDHTPPSSPAPWTRVQCGGEALPLALMRRFRAAWPHIALDNLYGPTEATVEAATWTCPTGAIGGAAAAALDHVPVGRPVANTRIHILEPHGEPAAVGVTGEVFIGGVQIARGYWRHAALTAERFVPDPFAPVAADGRDWGARLYRTGDLGRWRPDGTIELLGRDDFQVKIRGFRIELGEIEARLAAHEGIAAAVVMAREDAPGEKQLVAYYTVSDGAAIGAGGDIGAEALRAHLSSHLPAYMVPAAYVRLDTLPLTAHGKLDRRALPVPESGAYARPAYEAPQGEIERTIARIWSDMLGVAAVGRWDNFFELGGHSLRAVRVTTLLRDELKVQVTLADLFERPVVASLAEHVLNVRLGQFDARELASALKALQTVGAHHAMG